MKRLLALLLALVMIVGMVACGAQEEENAPVADTAPAADADTTNPPETEPVDDKVITTAEAELHFLLNAGSPHIQYLAEEVFPTYQEYFPNFEVEFDVMTDGYGEKLRIVCSSGNMPDIFSTADATALDTGTALALDDLIEKYNWRDHLKSGSSLMPYTDGKIYSLQDGRDGYYVPQLWYNKEIFEAAGCEVPETWDEFLEVCQKLKDYGVVPITCYAGTFAEIGLQMITETHGKDAFFKLASGELTWDDPTIVKAVEKLDQLLELGYFPEDAATIDYTASATLFNTGGAAMRLEPTWCYSGITLDQEDIDFLMLPTETGEKVRMQYGSYANGISISNTTKYPDEAFQFLMWITEQTAIYFEQHEATNVDVITGLAAPESAPQVAKSNAIVEDSSWFLDPYSYSFFSAAELSKLKEMCGILSARECTPAEFVEAMMAVTE